MCVCASTFIHLDSSDTDDGVLTALLLGPYVAASMLYGSITTPNLPLRPLEWLVDEPAVLSKSILNLSARSALLNSRRNLVQLTTLCSFVLLVHLFTSRRVDVDRPLASTSKIRGWRSWAFVGYSLLITVAAIVFHVVCDVLELEVWTGTCSWYEGITQLNDAIDLSYFDVAVISSFYQSSLYVMIRLSHGGFTLGEAGLVAQGATALFMEGLHVTIATVSTISTCAMLRKQTFGDCRYGRSLHRSSKQQGFLLPS